MASRHTLCLAAVICILLCSTSTVTDAANALTKGQSIRDGETLVSAGKIFELGFFGFNGSARRYLGIWYYGHPTQTTVWVANREHPVNSSSGTFSLTEDGSLVVLDGERRVLWSSSPNSNASAGTAGATSNPNRTVTAQLLDDGNLKVFLNITGGSDTSATPLWQSFEHPGETYLPGMRVGLDLRTNVNTLFRSWRSADDPSPGRYAMGNDPARTLQIMVWDYGRNPGDPQRLLWRSGPWDGQGFIGIEGMLPLNFYGFKYSNIAFEQKMYFWYAAFEGRMHRFVTQPDGELQELQWDAEKKSWNLYWGQPKNNCEFYNFCGDNAVCGEADKPKCSCLPGYQPRVEEEWKRGNWTAGCVKRAPLSTAGRCPNGRNSSGGSSINATAPADSTDGFLKVPGVKLPYLARWNREVEDSTGCRAGCLSNCSCTAYAYLGGIGCMVWNSEIPDTAKFSTGGHDLYVRVAASELPVGKRKSSSKVAAIVSSVAASVALITFCYVGWKCKKQNTEKSRDSSGLPIIRVNIESQHEHGELLELPTVTFYTLAAATDNFANSSIIGKGGFGPVYRGKFQCGQEIAVKRLSNSSTQGVEEFKNEVILIAKLQHRNLVRLLACCIEGEERLLIYEYMSNKSLDALLFDLTASTPRLDWRTRYNIIGGVARGLLYLHRDSRLRIIHRDLKAGNILLDEEMNPKISDFGMARIFGGDDNQNNTKRVVGTYGYMSPEYAMDGIFSVKSDVYSFGVLMAEILSGKRNNVSPSDVTPTNLLGRAWRLWNEDNAMEFIDPTIRGTCSQAEALKCMHIALLCVQDRANDRPTMSTVVVMLESENAIFPGPKQPTYTLHRSPHESDSSNGDHIARHSMNYLSTTVVIGR